MTPPLLRRTALATLVLLAACAAGPLQPDRAARAPTLEGFGETDWPVSTVSAAAQHWFTQGVLQAYAFNEAEAVRMFKAALAQDTDCAMCAWGVAWQLGPNINDPGRDRVAEALRYLDHALRHAANATPREKALMQALALRYGHASVARETAPLADAGCGTRGGDKADPLDVAYASKLRALADASPLDGDIVSLYAEAEMIATEGDELWHPETGAPAGRIAEVADRVERALGAMPRHIGLNHYMIHAVDARDVAHRAVAAADRLGVLAPGSPHLLHMPSHTYVRVGRFGDAARVNEAAVSAELKLFDAQKAQGFEVSKDWRNHDQSFLWYAALVDGRGDLAVATARDIASRVGKDKADNWYGGYRLSMPALALLRLERWQDLLAEPLSGGGKGMADVLGQHARGVALVRTGRLPEAREALLQAQGGAARVVEAYPKDNDHHRGIRGMADAAVQRLQAEIAFAEGRFDQAIALQGKAVEAAKRVDDNEPPMLAAGARVALGDMQWRAGRHADAEASFRADLRAQPGSGWALSGLAQALRSAGRRAEAETLQPQIDSAWARADGDLRRRFAPQRTAITSR